MIERIGYFKTFSYDTYEFGTRCSVGEQMSIYKDKIPDDSHGDCYRISLVDGTLVAERWEKENKEFQFVLASSAFRLI